MREHPGAPTPCDHCATARSGVAVAPAPGSAGSPSGPAAPVTPLRLARRRLYRSAVFPPPAQRPPRGRPGHPPDSGALPVITGIVLDVSPHVLLVTESGKEQAITLAPGTAAWRGRISDPTAIRAGDRVVVRLRPGQRAVADKIWAGIGRVTGTIVDSDSSSLLVDEGRTRRRQVVVIPSAAATRIQVRFPQLSAGSLIDLIGQRRGAVLQALAPATSQPAYPAERAPRVPAATAGARMTSLSGSAVWRETAHGEGDGVAYPAIDPSAGCAEVTATAGPSCASLPYLALGSMLTVRNECTAATRLLPVTGCCAAARLFCDRCLTCGTSPRARIAELSPAGFARLGGDLERGCFNATLAIGW